MSAKARYLAWIAVVVALLACGKSADELRIDPEVRQFGELLQLLLDAEEVQPWLYTSPDGTPYPVIIANDGVASLPSPPHVMKFGKPVIFISDDSANAGDFASCFWITDYTAVDSIARLMYYDAYRNIDIIGEFSMHNNHWVLDTAFIDSNGLTEEARHQIYPGTAKEKSGDR